MSYKVGVVSLGCDKNLVDTEVMLHLLNENQFVVVKNEYEADIIIVNTCCFIESATQESINTILNLADYKTQGKCRLLVVAGCMAERYKDEILKEMPEVDVVVGTGSYREIADAIKEGLEGGKILKFGDISTICNDNYRIQSTPNYMAYLKIAEGCSNFCTYCIIPKIRGRYRSRTIDSLYNEAKKLAANGVKELIVIAQDITRYGTDLYNKKMLPEMLNKLCTISELKWIRLLYCYPEGIDDELINIIKKQDKICKYLDIPIQHCSNEILKLMGRRTTKESLTEKINKLREAIPEIILRTSIIVGFPSETSEQFNELTYFINQTKFDRLGVFTYSREKDTPAAKFKNQVPKKVKEKRMHELLKLQQQISYNNNLKKIGNEYYVLVENKYDNDLYMGRTYMDAPDIDGQVYFYCNINIKPGDFVKVRITEVSEYDLTGEIVNESSK